MVDTYRVRFVIDEDAGFEECNGEARPLTEEEYRENEYMGCPNHPRGSKTDDTAIEGVGTCGACQTLYAPIAYAEYLQYYGNPDRHVYIGAIVEKQCGSCEAWSVADSLWHIDLMDDDDDLQLITLDKPMNPDQATRLPGYLGEVAREMLTEVAAATS